MVLKRPDELTLHEAWKWLDMQVSKPTLRRWFKAGCHGLQARRIGTETNSPWVVTRESVTHLTEGR